MDNCSVPGCRARITVTCKGSHLPTTFCNEHFTIHQNEPGVHEIVESRQVEISTKSNVYKIEDIQGNQNQAYFVFHFQLAGFFLALNTVDIHLPGDYKTTMDKITQMFTVDVCSLETGKSENLELKIKNYIEALRKIIYNIELNENNLREIITGAYNSLHSRIESFLSSGLIDLLNEAERSHNMPKSARKRFIISLDLDTEKQRFIQKYFAESDLNIEEMIEEFYNSFSYFMKDADKFFSSRFRDFEKKFKQEKNNITEETKKFLQERLSSFYDLETFMRVGLFTLRLTSSGPKIEIIKNWVMIISLILQKATCTLTGIVEISDDEILICISVGNESFIIYYSPTSSSIALAFSCVNFIIASGSTPDTILIAQNYPKSIDLYKLKSGKLEHSKRYNFNLESNEQIIGIAYIKSMEKAVFICDNNTLNSKVLSLEHRVNIALKNNTEKLLCLEYYKERKMICLKTPKHIRLYSEHLQAINVIEIPGSTFACINNENKEGYFLILGGENLIELRVDFGYDSTAKVNANLKSVFDDFEECKFSRSHDFSMVPSQRNKYLGNIYFKFGVPDFQQDLRNMLINPSQELRPDCIKLVPQINKASNVIPSPFAPSNMIGRSGISSSQIISPPLPPSFNIGSSQLLPPNYNRPILPTENSKLQPPNIGLIPLPPTSAISSLNSKLGSSNQFSGPLGPPVPSNQFSGPPGPPVPSNQFSGPPGPPVPSNQFSGPPGPPVPSNQFSGPPGPPVPSNQFSGPPGPPLPSNPLVPPSPPGPPIPSGQFSGPSIPSNQFSGPKPGPPALNLSKPSDSSNISESQIPVIPRIPKSNVENPPKPGGLPGFPIPNALPGNLPSPPIPNAFPGNLPSPPIPNGISNKLIESTNTSKSQQNIKNPDKDEDFETSEKPSNEKLMQLPGDKKHDEDSDDSSSSGNDIHIDFKKEKKNQQSILNKANISGGIPELPVPNIQNLKNDSPQKNTSSRSFNEMPIPQAGLPIPSPLIQSLHGESVQSPQIPRPPIPSMPGELNKFPPIPSPPQGESVQSPQIPRPPMPGEPNKFPPIPGPPSPSMPKVPGQYSSTPSSIIPSMPGLAQYSSIPNPQMSEVHNPAMPKGGIPAPPIPGGLFSGPPIPKMPSEPSLSMTESKLPSPPLPFTSANIIPGPPVPSMQSGPLPIPKIPSGPSLSMTESKIPSPPLSFASGNLIPIPPIPSMQSGPSSSMTESKLPSPPLPFASGNLIPIPPIPSMQSGPMPIPQFPPLPGGPSPSLPSQPILEQSLPSPPVPFNYENPLSNQPTLSMPPMPSMSDTSSNAFPITEIIPSSEHFTSSNNKDDDKTAKNEDFEESIDTHGMSNIPLPPFSIERSEYTGIPLPDSFPVPKIKAPTQIPPAPTAHISDYTGIPLPDMRTPMQIPPVPTGISFESSLTENESMNLPGSYEISASKEEKNKSSSKSGSSSSSSSSSSSDSDN
ncbi:hypothetical protein SteCoe_28246 [Stentor coeruleus]|uniref:Uncharacterized protein n=1 Tax=Stentor coeruleus TaxID=5963 RepID=A0A1R2B8P7_9CILI|nr:hypothetical protein SteCoe_28246 [Stentor coeruleus]